MANYTSPNPLYNKKSAYSDFDTDFNVHPVTGKLSVKKNVEAVKQAVKNLILTDKLERPYEPFFGCDVNGALFEQLDNLTAASMEKHIQYAIRNFEPRASLLRVFVQPNDEKNSITVTVVFAVVNVKEPQTLQINLERIR